MPELVIVAGPNGTGKTSFTKQFVRVDDWLDVEFVNADEIAESLPKEISQTERDFKAARIMIERIENIIERQENLIIETTLATARYKSKIPKWRAIGYRVTLIYLQMSDAVNCISRVAKRVSRGGHNIPTATIVQRFQRSRDRLEQDYKPIVDAWYVYDSIEGDFLQVASGGLDEQQ
jgi:predicted ABC-type ATPase